MGRWMGSLISLEKVRWNPKSCLISPLREMGRAIVGVAVALCTFPISIFVNRIVTEPYMDEIFHVPQAQQYCRGNFRSWDPMITTPPGLYFLSLAYLASIFPGLSFVLSFSELCSTSALRFTNSVMAVICGILIFEIMSVLSPSLGDEKRTFRALVLSLYPLHWFFTFLYYTDVASLTAVLAMYLLALKHKYFFSSLIGAFSVLIRQTNIIWMLFVACAGVIDFTESHSKHRSESVEFSSSKEDPNSSTSHGGASKLRRRRTREVPNRHGNICTPNVLVPTAPSAGLVDEVQHTIIILWNHFWDLLVAFSPFFVVFTGFIAFVWWNGSIVLGAKDAHKVSPHVSQLLYYGVVSCLFTFPIHFSLRKVGSFLFCKNVSLLSFQWLVGLTVGLISVHFFSIAHPYLLADNRHYTFYIWRRIINYHGSMKYLMVPLYVYSWFSIVTTLGNDKKRLWILAYFFACIASLVPAPLIELRYYTIPFFFMALHSDISDRSWILMGILYLSINCFTTFMFLFRPFHWDHEAGTQRFIW